MECGGSFAAVAPLLLLFFICGGRGSIYLIGLIGPWVPAGHEHLILKL